MLKSLPIRLGKGLFIIAQKLSKRELGERLLLLKEKQELLAKEINALTQKINELALPFVPKELKNHH